MFFIFLENAIDNEVIKLKNEVKQSKEKMENVDVEDAEDIDIDELGDSSEDEEEDEPKRHDLDNFRKTRAKIEMQIAAKNEKQNEELEEDDENDDKMTGSPPSSPSPSVEQTPPPSPTLSLLKFGAGTSNNIPEYGTSGAPDSITFVSLSSKQGRDGVTERGLEIQFEVNTSYRKNTGYIEIKHKNMSGLTYKLDCEFKDLIFGIKKNDWPYFVNVSKIMKLPYSILK